MKFVTDDLYKKKSETEEDDSGDRLFENSREISLQIRYKRSCDFPAWLNPATQQRQMQN